MKFCPKCSNLLYHIEDSDTIILKCHNCGHKEENSDNVLVTTLYKKSNEPETVSNEFSIYDPTLPRTIHRQCPNDKCMSRKDNSLQEAVFKTADKTTLELIYICCVCQTEWKYS